MTTLILAPGASEVGFGAAALVPLGRDNAHPRLKCTSAAIGSEVALYAQAAYLRAICSELDVRFCHKATKCA